jgi:hypothetical protein
VTNSGTNGPDPTDQTSSSELNPLQNPTLGRNLGRWAQVYFTNPPERREQAVVDLLRELETGNATVPNGSSSRKLGDSVLSCPVCQCQSEPGQNFCGLCGSPLAAISGVRKDNRALVGNNPLPSFTAISPPDDAQWLRDRVLASFISDVPKRQTWKYLSAVILLALAGLGYLGWSARTARARSATLAAEVPSEPKIEAHKPSQITPADSQSENMSLSEPLANNVESRANPDGSAQGATLAGQRQRLGIDSADLTSESAVENGARELLIARRYLDGMGGTQDIPEAAKWLWKAVGKQNTGAAVLLADLYIRGDGVPKNCDQARLLLVAAAKKGASDAAEKLRNLASGCS